MATSSLEMIRVVAVRLGPLVDRVVFLGGAVVGLLVDDPAAEPPRATDDVDVIVDASSYRAFNVSLAADLRDLGFEIPMGAQIGRWSVDGISVDVMPTGESALGFSNRWYRSAFASATAYRFPDGLSIRVVTAPCFIATKLEAFKGRGGGVYVGSQDLEDVVTLADGRPGLAEEIRASADDVRTYVAGEARRLLADPAFVEALPGFLRGDPASQARLPALVATLRRVGSG